MDFLKLRECPQFAEQAAAWFHEKWGIPKAAYEESIAACIAAETFVPQWYLVMEDGEMIAGLGVIENDFHDRKDLTPNVCAVYVEKLYRGRGIAGEMLSRVCADFAEKQIDTLYLVTDHTSFYERYGWEFLCMVRGDGESEMTRMYVHKSR